MRNLFVVALSFVALFNVACSGADKPPSSDESTAPASDDSTDSDAGSGSSLPAMCDSEHVGCPCPTEGAAFSCGHIKRKIGNYVTCAEEFSVCENGVWGQCSEDVVGK